MDEYNDLENYDYDDEDELDAFNTETFAGTLGVFLFF